MTQANADQGSNAGKGKAFFDRAVEVAGTGNWDFAIELYLEGIRREPENIERGHQPLREVALKRTALGGKGPGMMQSFKRRAVKDPLDSLINAEYLLGKEPGSVTHMEQVLKAAQSLKLANVAKWICDILLEAQRQAKRPSKRLLMILTEAYAGMEEHRSAIEACEMARKVTPDDARLQDILQDLGAKDIIKRGRYDQEGDFTQSIKGFDEQKKLMQKEALVKGQSYLDQQIDATRKDYEAAPTTAGKINAYVDALLAIEDDAHEQQAIDVLAKAHQDTGSYQFKARIGDVRIRQMTRKRRDALAAGDREAAAELARQQLRFELGEFAERAASYPTDMALKYELGRRQLAVGQVDDAIGSLQQAQRDPRRRVVAMNLLGQAFEKKQWYREAAETLAKALESEMTEELAKELRYNLGSVLEKMGDLQRARDEFSRVAQMDYNFKDVRHRLEAIRKKLVGPQGP